jgi:ABC-type uncharacterized transport system involved in gliding motility auxiliary subunit
VERKQRARAQTGIYLLVVAAVLVFANLLSFTIYSRVDLTKNERFTLSKGSARLVNEGLKQQMQVDVYVTRGLPKHELFIQDLTDLLNEYEQASEGKLTYSIVEPKTEEEREKARKAGLQEGTFGDVSATGEDQATIAKGFMGMVFKYGSEEDVIPVLSPDQAEGLEFWITNMIREVRDRADNITHKFGLVTGKEEIKLGDANLVPTGPGAPGQSLKSIMERFFPFYHFEDVDLQEGEAEINQELNGIIITQPEKDFTEKELRRVDEFLMRGDKALVVFASAVSLKAADPSMKATLSLHGLDKLLTGYGVEMKNEAILDWGRSLSIPVQNQDGQAMWFRSPGLVQVAVDDRFDEEERMLDDSFAAFFRLDELAFPFPSPLVPLPDKQPEATVKVVARSSPRATVTVESPIDMSLRLDWQEKGEHAQYPIAVAVEGPLKSAFEGAGDSGISAPAKSAAPSRVLVVSSSQFLANPFARAGNPPPMPPQMAMMGAMGGDKDLQMLAGPYANKYLRWTILAFKNTLDWMSGDSDLLAASAKLFGEPNLTYGDIEKPSEIDVENPEELEKRMEEYRNERKDLQQSVQWTLTFLAPLLFAAFGILRWRRREAARESIRI